MDRRFLFRTRELVPVHIGMPAETEERLKKTCFRGKGVPLAGNFLHWSGFQEFMDDIEVSVKMLRCCWRGLQGPEAKRFRFTLDFERPIGWNSTADIRLFEPEDLDLLKLNGTVIGKRVTNHQFPVPLTYKVTVAASVKPDEDGRLILVQSLYPGEDVGELRPRQGQKDLSELTGRVFYDFSHPGESL